MSKRHDRLFKELLTLFLYEFLELFLPEIAEAIDPASIEFFDKEMFTELGLGDRREADLVARVAIDGRPAFCLVHVEHQAQHDDVFARRMFRYWNILYERYDLPVYPIAVFSYSTRQVIPEGYEVTTLGFTPLAFKFRAIHLKRLAWRDFARRENPVAAALMARMRVPKRERPRVK
ncbi:MAG: Rpn family recombination-promoting nuclease/putative transposase, partial [Candidatus Eremiobacteraeota bacterium]|nr:Rpn family recombination-promoting nuclease/putative transposase [Candidatus Eremiobacteraeota bacterium]